MFNLAKIVTEPLAVASGLEFGHKSVSYQPLGYSVVSPSLLSERLALSEDATALCRGVSRSLLEELRNSLRCHGLVLWSVTLAARRKPRNPSYDFCSGEREPPRRKAVASANPSDVFCSDERAEFNGAVMKFLTAH